MKTILNIVILLLESLYYSMFIRYTKRHGNLLKNLLCFTIATVILLPTSTDKIYSYLLAVVIMLYCLKYIAGYKVSVYDMLVLFVMLIFKTVIEIPFSLLIYGFIKNIYIVTTLVCFIKIFIVWLLKYKLGSIDMRLKRMWDNNNFYVRYVFTAFMLIYTLVSCLYCIIQWR